jgi:penicillin-binding protein 2
MNENRQRYFLGIVITVFVIYVVRLFYVQVIDDSYTLSAKENAIREVTVFPARGLIYDKKGRLIVGNITIYDLKVVPSRIDKQMDTAAFCQLLGINDSFFVAQTQAAKKYSVYKPSSFITQLRAEEYTKIQEHLYEYPGFFAEPRIVRAYNYPNGAHFLGYIGEASPKIIKQSNGFYQQGDYIGISGLEKSYENLLGGTRGIYFQYVDVHNRVQGKFKDGAFDKEPIAGARLDLGIDAELQQYAELLLQNKRGAAVAINPQNGEILAYVSSPTYDPNLLVGRQRGKVINVLQRDAQKPLFDRAAMSSQNPPGSTFKLAQGLIALQEGVLNTTTTYSCYGGYSLGGGKRVKCHPHASSVQLQFGVTTSCNGYFCNVFRTIINKYPTPAEGFKVWRAYIEAFGFGNKTGIDLPNELSGLIGRQKFYDKYYGAGRWHANTIISLAIGQGEIGATPLQLANYTCILANRGWYITPHIVSKINGKPNPDPKYTKKHYTRIARQYYDLIAQGMQGVMEQGTGRGVQIEGIKSCGKTGTAQNPQGKDNSIFIFFAPAQNPTIAVAVYVENAGFGATWAGPIATLMAEKYINDTIATKRIPMQERMYKGNLLTNGLKEIKSEAAGD